MCQLVYVLVSLKKQLEASSESLRLQLQILAACSQSKNSLEFDN